MFVRYDRRTFDAEGSGAGGGGAAGAGAGGTGGGDGGAGGQAAWYTGKVDAETLGHWQNKGWDITDPVKIATSATQAHREAERFVGAPASELVRLPKAGDEAGQRALWQRLGAPSEAAGYDFAEVKFADGTAVDAAFADTMRGTFHRLGIAKDAAAEVARSVIKFMEGAEASEATERTVALQKEKDTLKQNWGQNGDANAFIARQAAGKLGVTEAELNALEGQIGYARVMEMFRSIGTRMGEDKYVNSGGGSGSGVMTRDQAVARRSELMRDDGWSKRYMAGGTAEARELTGLLTLIHGDDSRESRSY